MLLWKRYMPIDVKKCLDDQGVKWKDRGKNCSPGWVNVKCPFCHDHSNHMGICLENSQYHCWNCGEQGWFPMLLMELLNIDYKAARKIAAPYQDYYYSNPGRLPQKKITDEIREIIPKEAVKKIPDIHRQYLISRRYDPDYMTQKYDLWFCGNFGKFKWRIIIPIKVDNIIVNFVGMSVIRDFNLTPYKNCPDEIALIDRRNLVYNIDSIKNRRALIVEGIADAWRFGDGTVATLTTSFTQAQVNLLAKKADQFFIMYDSKSKDPNAPRQALQLGRMLASIGKDVRKLNLDQGDPDDLSDEQAQFSKKQYSL